MLWVCKSKNTNSDDYQYNTKSNEFKRIVRIVKTAENLQC